MENPSFIDNTKVMEKGKICYWKFMENIKEEIMEMKIHGSNMKKKKLLKIMENLKSEYWLVLIWIRLVWNIRDFSPAISRERKRKDESFKAFPHFLL